MKQKHFISTVLILVVITLFSATYVEVPAIVLKTFNGQYPSATNVKWEKIAAEYEAEFLLNGKNYEASFKPTGEWRETGLILETEKIPVAIITSFGTLYPNAELEQVVYIEKGVRGVVYEVEYTEDGKVLEVYLRTDGDRVPDFSEEEEEKYEKD